LAERSRLQRDRLGHPDPDSVTEEAEDEKL
jgi:hypothetical protein